MSTYCLGTINQRTQVCWLYILSGCFRCPKYGVESWLPSRTTQIKRINWILADFEGDVGPTQRKAYFDILSKALVNVYFGLIQTHAPAMVVSRTNKPRFQSFRVSAPMKSGSASHLDQTASVPRSWNWQRKQCLAPLLFFSTSSWRLEKFESSAGFDQNHH